MSKRNMNLIKAMKMSAQVLLASMLVAPVALRKADIATTAGLRSSSAQK